MAIPVWVTDLTDIDLDPIATTSYAALGGGPAGLNAETDYYVQGGASPSCLSKNAWTNAAKGMVNDTDGIPWTVPTDGVLLLWGYYGAPASLDTKANGGARIVAGSGLTAYYSYYYGGKDTLTFETFIPLVVDPNNATYDAIIGTPSGTWNVFGLICYLPTTSGPTKGSPIAIDALRYGRHTLSYTGGTSTDPDSTFYLTEAYANALARRWGNIEYNKGSYFLQGFHSLGTASAALVMTDSNVKIFLRAAGNNCETNDAVSTGYTRFEIINASTVVTWDNIQITALGTRARGVFVHTSGSWIVTNGQFTGVDTFSLLAATSMTDCIFTGCNAITAPGSDLSGSQILTPTVAANTSGLIWNVATDPDGLLDDMSFSKGINAHHAIEFGTSSPLSMNLNNISFSGFNASNGQNDSALHIKRTTGTVTINIIDGDTPSYKTDGATVNIVVNPVSTEITVISSLDSSVIPDVAVLVKAKDNTGDLPYQEVVTITRSGTVATVAHSGHGFSVGKKVELDGANQDEYNRVKTILTVPDANSYTYEVLGSPVTPATGTIIATGVVIDGITDISGEISDTRSYSLNQPIKGDAKKGNLAPLYITSPISGTVDKNLGTKITVVLNPD